LIAIGQLLAWDPSPRFIDCAQWGASRSGASWRQARRGHARDGLAAGWNVL